MNSFIHNFNIVMPEYPQILRAGGILLLGMLILSMLGRFVFGKKSVFVTAVSSAIGILFIYAVTVVFYALGGRFSALAAPLPLIQIHDFQLALFTFSSADYTVICSELVSVILLAFFVNLLDQWLPRGKNLVSWLLLRILTVAIAFIVHLAIAWTINQLLPEGILTYAPAIVLAIILLMMLTGILKLPIGLVLTTVNPLIAAFYTFFFANVVGKQISKAVLTTLLLTALVLLLNYLGMTVFSIASAALVAYIPFLVLLVGLWYLVTHIL